MRQSNEKKYICRVTGKKIILDQYSEHTFQDLCLNKAHQHSYSVPHWLRELIIVPLYCFGQPSPNGLPFYVWLRLKVHFLNMVSKPYILLLICLGIILCHPCSKWPWLGTHGIVGVPHMLRERDVVLLYDLALLDNSLSNELLFEVELGSKYIFLTSTFIRI